MKIAIPLAEGRISLHFGHCQEFALIDVDEASKQITNTEMQVPPMHAPGVLPNWLAENKVNVLIASGMGMRAQQLLTQQGIEVVIGAAGDSIEAIVAAYLDETLESGANICDH